MRLEVGRKVGLLCAFGMVLLLSCGFDFQARRAIEVTQSESESESLTGLGGSAGLGTTMTTERQKDQAKQQAQEKMQADLFRQRLEAAQKEEAEKKEKKGEKEGKEEKETKETLPAPYTGGGYVIDVGDILGISVWRVSDLSVEVTVRPDGQISFPLLGELQAAGLTFQQLRETLIKGLSEYIREPEVIITLKGAIEKRVTVLGAVRSPGAFTFSGDLSILEAISRAGGFEKYADTSNVVVIRGGLQEKPHACKVNVSRILGGRFEKNMFLQANDAVYVKSSLPGQVQILLRDWVTPLLDTAVNVEVWRKIESDLTQAKKEH